MIYAFNLGMLGEKIYDFQCIFHMTLHAEREGFESLQKKKGMKGSKCRAGIAQDAATVKSAP